MWCRAPPAALLLLPAVVLPALVSPLLLPLVPPLVPPRAVMARHRH
jgi:hypothetical protein